MAEADKQKLDDNDPSMQEILQSIKRIISDDEPQDSEGEDATGREKKSPNAEITSEEVTEETEVSPQGEEDDDILELAETEIIENIDIDDDSLSLSEEQVTESHDDILSAIDSIIGDEQSDIEVNPENEDQQEPIDEIELTNSIEDEQVEEEIELQDVVNNEPNEGLEEAIDASSSDNFEEHLQEVLEEPLKDDIQEMAQEEEIVENTEQAVDLEPENEVPNIEEEIHQQESLANGIEENYDMQSGQDMTNDEPTETNQHIDSEEIISNETASATSAMIDSFIKKISEQQAQQTVERVISPSMSFRSGTTVEDLVIEAIKPVIKEWMDENLPKMVESIIEKEIRRLIPQ